MSSRQHHFAPNTKMSMTKAGDKGPQGNAGRAYSTLGQWQRLCLVMKCGGVTTFQVLSAIRDAVDLLLACVHGEMFPRDGGMSTQKFLLVSCIAPRKTALGQGNLTAGRSESMNESTVAP